MCIRDRGNIIRLDNSLNNFPQRITAAENELDTLHQQQAAAQIEVEKPFPQEEELADVYKRQTQSHIQIDKSVLAGVHLFEKVSMSMLRMFYL